MENKIKAIAAVKETSAEIFNDKCEKLITDGFYPVEGMQIVPAGPEVFLIQYFGKIEESLIKTV